jgi:glycosyltransferase involved in cell wall biosynthesis
MSSFFSFAWGVSEYNCSQLQEAGYKKTAGANPPYDFRRFSQIEPCSGISKDENYKNILFVGRISPNKRQEDIIRAFYFYHKINSNSGLTLVGSYKDFENYKKDLENLSEKLNVPVNITDVVSNKELIAYYLNADLFLCMSEHEGFCVPIVEAMYFGVPVLAFYSSAIPETIGEAGIIFKQKHFPAVAHLMDEVLTNIPLQEKMKAAGKEKAMYYGTDNVSKRLIKLIEDYAFELGL